jgi:hypothetical protein
MLEQTFPVLIRYPFTIQNVQRNQANLVPVTGEERFGKQPSNMAFRQPHLLTSDSGHRVAAPSLPPRSLAVFPRV